MRKTYVSIEDVLRSPWVSERPTEQKPSVTDRVLRSTRLEDSIYADLRGADEALDAVERTAGEKLRSFPALSRDVYQSFYSLMPRRREDAELSAAARKFNAHILDHIIQSEDYPTLKAVCEGRELPAYEAASEFITRTAGELDDLLGNIGGEKGSLHTLEKLEQAEEKLAEQSNAPISPDSADGIVRRLARGISRTLDETIMLGRKYREGDAELKRAVTNVSHDLRTPLTSAAGYAGLLKKSGLTPKQAEYLSVIEGRISAMRRLTEELLAYSVAASDETEPVLAEVDIAAALEDSLTQFYAAFEERGISPSIDIPQNEVVRIADKDALARVFGNVISNAVRCSDGDFCVTMKENGEITFENAASSLDEVSAKRLFDRFFTVENARGSA